MFETPSVETPSSELPEQCRVQLYSSLRRILYEESPIDPCCSNAGHVQDRNFCETDQISGLMGCSDLACQRGDLEDDSFPNREPVQFLQLYRSDVFIATTADYQAS